VSLPGADELFRTTGGMALRPPPPRPGAGTEPEHERLPSAPAQGADGESEGAGVDPYGQVGADHTQAPDPEARPAGEHGTVPGQRGPARPAEPDDPEQHAATDRDPARPAAAKSAAAKGSSAKGGTAAGRRSRARGGRRPSGRERHDEKITVYVSAEELMDLEQARLALRGEFGLAVDRGRIVREAVAVVLADLESRGDASILVRRLRGR
jgi:hypothetical protein